uniref:Uncharacterized protein n=1 Tax=Anopheles minimus TaxID=112268 RepID=A0A182WE08_9DIPT
MAEGNVVPVCEVLEVQPTDDAQHETVPRQKSFKISKDIANGALDISLLTANANQLRLLLTYNEKSSSYFVCITLVIISLVLEILEGCGIIIMKTYPSTVRWLGFSLTLFVPLITVINVLLAVIIQV